MKRYAITVRGKEHSWSFHVNGKPEWAEDWRADGLEVGEVYNSIPDWVVDLGLMRPWVFLQDCFYFRNPFARS